MFTDFIAIDKRILPVGQANKYLENEACTEKNERGTERASKQANIQATI